MLAGGDLEGGKKREGMREAFSTANAGWTRPRRKKGEEGWKKEGGGRRNTSF